MDHDSLEFIFRYKVLFFFFEKVGIKFFKSSSFTYNRRVRLCHNMNPKPLKSFFLNPLKVQILDKIHKLPLFPHPLPIAGDRESIEN